MFWGISLKRCTACACAERLSLLVSTTGMPRRGWRVSEDLSRAVWQEIQGVLAHPQQGGHELMETTSATFPGQVAIAFKFKVVAIPLQVAAVPRTIWDPANTVEVPRKVVVVPFMGKISAV